MRATRFLAAFWVILGAGVALTIGAVVLPGVATAQTLVSNGPISPYGFASYQISGYFFPSIAKGQTIDVNVSNYTPGSIEISLFPSQPYSVSPTGTPLLFLPALEGSYSHVVLTSPETQPYGMYVTSQNRSTYTLVVKSVWSPYYVIRVYLPEGIFLIILGIVGVINFTESRRREAEVRRVMSELEARKAGSPNSMA
ncbi:MAG TPA: hypothetical protein VLY21_00510 [Nitrososphaerales archaeon]|nr:hypothetical protein [Nitrososphaerales archaeon]